jgi:hypothetical protein
VIAPVDLDQLAAAGAALPRLIAPTRAVHARHPDVRRDHPRPQRLDRQRERVLLGQLLMRERRPKVGIVLTDERDGAVPRDRCDPPRARTSAPARRERGSARANERPIEPLHLTLAEP